MARRDVIKSRQKSVTARAKPGAAARTYAAAPSPESTTRGNERTTSMVDRARDAMGTPGRDYQARPWQFGERATMEKRVLQDPRMGYTMSAGPTASQIAFGTMGSVADARPTYDDATSAPRGLLSQLVSPERAAQLEQERAAAEWGTGPADPNFFKTGYGFANGQFNVPGVTDITAYDEFIDAEQQRVTDIMALRNLAIAEGQDEVAAAYNDQISAIQGDIADAKRARADVSKAFERYRGTVDPYLQEAVEVAADTDLSKLEGMQNADVVTAAFTSGVEEVDRIANLIGAGNPALAEQVAASATEFQAMAEDALREDMSSLYRVEEAGKQYAADLAAALQQQDITMTDIERQKIEIDIQKQIDALQEQLADTEKAKQAAMAKVAEDYAAQFGLPSYFENADEAYNAALGEFLDLRGVTPEDGAIIAQMVSDMRKDGIGDRKAAEGWVRSLAAEHNLDELYEAFARSGNDLEGQLQAAEANGDYTLRAKLEQWAADPKGRPNPIAAAVSGDMDLMDPSEFRYALDAFDLWKENDTKWGENKQFSRSYANAVADSYGFQGGTSGVKGRVYQGSELNQLLMDAALYVYKGDRERAQAAVSSGALQRIIQSESGGVVGRLNYAGTEELKRAGIPVEGGYNTAAFIDLLDAAGRGQFGSAWPAGRGGKRHSASGLGQLNASNYARYASEFGGTAAVGNPFAEAVAALRYAEAAHGSLSRALAFKIKNGNW